MYTAADIDRAIEARAASPCEAWESFRRSLVTIGVGTDPFSFGKPKFRDDLDADFVFSVTDHEGGVRYFKRYGYLVNHFGLTRLSGPTVEVRPTATTVYEAIT